jgi:hypothetical protein
VVSVAPVNVREGGEGRFYVRLDRQPQTLVLVTVARSGGDAHLTVKSGATMTFSPTDWASWRRVTLAAAVDENATNDTATFQVSMPNFTTDVTAVSLDGEIGENLARTGGSTITGTAGSFGRTNLVDGVHTSSANYGYTVWTNASKPTITLDLKDTATVSRIRLLNFDWVKQVQRYRLEGSTDGATWTDLAPAAQTTDRQGWDEWPLADVSARYVRFTGLTNSVSSNVCIAEWEVYGIRPPLGSSPAPAKSLTAKIEPVVVEIIGTPAPAPVTPPAEGSEPVWVMTSDDIAPDYESGWDAVDGDPETAWTGKKVGGGYMVVEYAPALKLKTLELDLVEGSLTNVQYLYSLDAQDWHHLPEDMESHPVDLNFLWLLFPDDGTTAVPNVLEIRPNP